VNNHTHLQEAVVVIRRILLAAARFDRNGIVGVEVNRVLVRIAAADYNMRYAPAVLMALSWGD